jgi:hypothetical protein
LGGRDGRSVPSRNDAIASSRTGCRTPPSIVRRPFWVSTALRAVWHRRHWRF